NLLKLVVRLSAADDAAVDEEGRRAVDAGIVAGLEIGVDAILVLVCVKARIELLGVQPERRGGRPQIRLAELVLIGEQSSVVRPELALLVRALRRFGGRTRVGAVGQR